MANYLKGNDPIGVSPPIFDEKTHGFMGGSRVLEGFTMFHRLNLDPFPWIFTKVILSILVTGVGVESSDEKNRRLTPGPLVCGQAI